MAKRSLRLSAEGVRKAKQSFAAKGWTQEYLAIEVGIKTRQPIWKFFAGEGIERFTFFEICTLLEIDWREVTLDPPSESIDLSADRAELEPKLASMSLDALVQLVRSQRQEKINYQCGVLQLINMSRPVTLHTIYVEPGLLEQIPSQQALDSATINSLTPEEIDLPNLGRPESNQITGFQALEKYPKIRILGKPGIGKTTLLKYLALECNHGQLATHLVPFFMSVRDFAESYQHNSKPDLLDFIYQEFMTSEISELEIIQKLLNGGRMLLLIDGMDEVTLEEGNLALNEIRRFAERYYRNQFVLSRRTAHQKLVLSGFTDLEIRPLTLPKVKAFVQKWFGEFEQTTSSSGLTKASQFMEMLELPEKRRFRRLVTTPLFLHLACYLFQNQSESRIKKADFYKSIVYLLYEKLDEFKGIRRKVLHPKLVLPQMLDFSCEFAFSIFENKQFLYTKELVGQHLTRFAEKLLPDDTPPEERYHTTEVFLEAAKAQPYGFVAERGLDIFSFSYLALHEYLTARKVVVNYEIEKSEEFLEKLMQHITDPDWREVFLLTASMLINGDRFVELMRQQIDSLVADDPYLQEFLSQTHQKLQMDVRNTVQDEVAEISAAESPDLGFSKLLQQIGDHLPSDYRLQMPQLQQQLKFTIATYQEIINQWEFRPEQEEILQNYYAANQLLLDCLRNYCVVSPAIREEIEATLLLLPSELNPK